MFQTQGKNESIAFDSDITAWCCHNITQKSKIESRLTGNKIYEQSGVKCLEQTTDVFLKNLSAKQLSTSDADSNSWIA